MRELRLPCDVPDVADCEGSCVGGGGPPCILHAGRLCCPDDPLETVLGNPDIFSDDLLEDLLIAAALPPPHQGWLWRPITTGGGASSDDGAPRLPEDDGSWTTSSLEAKSPPPSRLAPANAAMSDSSSWTTPSSLETESPPPPRMPVHAAALSDSSWAPSSLETESSPPPSVPRVVVPRKKRDTSVMRGKRLWTLDIPNVPASRDKPSGRDVWDQDGRRLLVARRPRNRRTQRGCSHCATTETPQWRAGPDGPGTLCNACGIRYKMNKLLPEYRPSTSPSFRSDKHSNRHRKVVKLMEKKVKVEKIVNTQLAPADYGGDFMDDCKYILTSKQFN